VLVDDLLLAIALQQNAERVKARHDTLQPNTVGEEDRDWRPSAKEVIEKRILESVDIILCHFLLVCIRDTDFLPQRRQDHDICAIGSANNQPCDAAAAMRHRIVANCAPEMNAGVCRAARRKSRAEASTQESPGVVRSA
jgi:hypothetical protein